MRSITLYKKSKKYDTNHKDWWTYHCIQEKYCKEIEQKNSYILKPIFEKMVKQGVHTIIVPFSGGGDCCGFDGSIEYKDKNDKENGQNKMNGGLSSETVKPREDLPPLLVNLAERERERVHWTGTAFGLTSELYRFWSKSGYEPVYVRQVPSDITGEHSCVMLRVCNANDSDDDDAPEGNWLAPFTDDFRVRFRSLLGAPFRELSPSLALSVLNPQVQYDDNDKQSGAGRDAVIRTDNEILSPHDLRRLEKYSSSLVDHHVITDLVPPITRAYYAIRIPATVSYAQAAILLGMGLQQKT